ncbi:MAG: ComEC/Rec2 family competence protein [Candidatus Moraniibacteriota bacterium]
MNEVLSEIDNVKNNVGEKLFGVAIVKKDVVQKGWKSDVVLTYIEGNTVLIKDEKYTDLKWGSLVNLKCITGLPEQYNDFDYQKYLFMNGVEYICDDFEYETIGFEQSILSRLAVFRNKMESIVNNIIPSPQAALANGLLFGGDDRLSDELQNNFSTTGMTHIVAVSGYNVSVIVAVVMGIVIFMGVNRRHSVIFAILAVIFFVALIGFPSSGVRAAIMGSMILIAASYGRVSHAYGAIFFTGAIMIAFNPLLLRYDVGFQLSFLATLGIVAVYPILEKYFVSKNKAFGIVDILLLTVSAQILVLPIIAYNFHTISVVSLLANILILPIIPVTMLLVFMTVVSSFVFYPIALMFGWMAYFLLSYEIFIIDILSKISWSSIAVEDVNIMWFIIYYVIVVSIVYFVNKKILYET